MNLTAEQWDERERRLDADIADARKALQNAQGHFDRLCEERREMRYQRRQQLATTEETTR
jgi:F0F1-type ATP synthase membrane subunit b/b'